MIAIYPFQTQAVRDLAWACFSPPLLTLGQQVAGTAPIVDCPLALNPSRMHWLETLERDASALLQHLSLRPTRRLGLYFEQLWHFFLQQDPAVELIAKNLPVQDGGRTLGEFDCIYYCHQRQRHIHAELAVKYFLGLRSATANTAASEHYQWLGPNTRDRLDRKVEHLSHQQLRLADTTAARIQLASLGIEELEREAIFKGYLFTHHRQALSTPAGYNPECALSEWVALEELPGFLAAPSGSTLSYVILPRLQWLSPVRCDEPGTMHSADALQSSLQRHFAEHTRPLLVAALDAQGWESRRFFVTSDNWPGEDYVD